MIGSKFTYRVMHTLFLALISASMSAAVNADSCNVTSHIKNSTIQTPYEGECQNGVAHGAGKYSVTTGSALPTAHAVEGQFMNGMLNGRATITSHTKRGIIRTEATFRDNVLNGPSRTELFDGRVAEGIYRDGKIVSGVSQYMAANEVPMATKYENGKQVVVCRGDRQKELNCSPSERLALLGAANPPASVTPTPTGRGPASSEIAVKSPSPSVAISQGNQQGGMLSRDVAATLLGNNDWLPRKDFGVDVQIGSEVPIRAWIAHLKKGDPLLATNHMKTYDCASKSGALKVVELKRPYIGPNDTPFSVTVTSTGRQQGVVSKQGNYNYWKPQLASEEFYEVTGIKLLSATQAEATFTTITRNGTSLGHCIGSSVDGRRFQATAVFGLYDTGWKIEDVLKQSLAGGVRSLNKAAVIAAGGPDLITQESEGTRRQR